jgi:hypothetical protein
MRHRARSHLWPPRRSIFDGQGRVPPEEESRLVEPRSPEVPERTARWPQAFPSFRLATQLVFRLCDSTRASKWAPQRLTTIGSGRNNFVVMPRTLDPLKRERCTSGWPKWKLPWPKRPRGTRAQWSQPRSGPTGTPMARLALGKKVAKSPIPGLAVPGMMMGRHGAREEIDACGALAGPPHALHGLSLQSDLPRWLILAQP